MSLFLGPIHHWLFRKIQLQDKLVNHIVNYIDEKNNTVVNNEVKQKVSVEFINSLKAELESYGNLPVERLEDAIDVGNIHGWLQSCVTMVEYKLAVCITRIMELEEQLDDNIYIDELRQVFYDFGFAYMESEWNQNGDTQAELRVLTPKEGYKLLQDILLDGMPCDRASVLVESHENYVVWERNLCVHKEYYDKIGGNVTVFYELRDELIKGIMYNTGISYEVIDEGVYRLYIR